MKVAISTDGNAVSAHFGRCPTDSIERDWKLILGNQNFAS